MSLWNLTSRLLKRREDRLLQLEREIIELERARDEQIDINDRIRREHEDVQRRREHEHEDRVRALKHEVEGLKLKAQAADEELGHLLKIRDEKRDIELERFKIKVEREAQEEIAEVKDEYQTKIEEHLNGRISDLGKMYAELLARLPDVNVALKGRIGG